MGAPGSRVKVFVTLGVFLCVLVIPLAAGAQQIPTPGESPEEVKEWTYYISFPIALGTVGLALLVGLTFLRQSSRFFGREEPPKIPERRRPQFAGAVAPAPVGAPRVEQVAAASTTPPAAPAAEVQTAAEQVPVSKEAEAKPEEKPPAEEPTVEAKPAAEAKAEAPPAPAPAEHVEPDQEAYERELQAQLDKGTDRRVAEGRAKAAAIRSARAKATGPAPAPEASVQEASAQEAPAAEEKEEKEEKKEEHPAGETGKAPAVVEEPSPEAKQAQEPPKQVEAPAPAEEKEEPAEKAPEKPVTPTGDLDKETFDRILQEQLDAGLARPIAEGRARAAAIKAAREKASAG